MGTDIHVVVEERWSWNPQWEPTITDDGKVFELFVWRDYNVFRRITDVRSDGIVEPICETPRGLPDDVSLKARDHFIDREYHSVTWITAAEFRDAFPWETDVEKMSHFAMMCWPYAIAKYGPPDVRFLIGFDS